MISDLHGSPPLSACQRPCLGHLAVQVSGVAAEVHCVVPQEQWQLFALSALAAAHSIVVEDAAVVDQLSHTAASASRFGATNVHCSC